MHSSERDLYQRDVLSLRQNERPCLTYSIISRLFNGIQLFAALLMLPHLVLDSLRQGD